MAFGDDWRLISDMKKKPSEIKNKFQIRSETHRARHKLVTVKYWQIVIVVARRAVVVYTKAFRQ